MEFRDAQEESSPYFQVKLEALPKKRTQSTQLLFSHQWFNVKNQLVNDQLYFTSVYSVRVERSSWRPLVYLSSWRPLVYLSSWHPFDYLEWL
jgi:hypothetical protein